MLTLLHSQVLGQKKNEKNPLPSWMDAEYLDNRYPTDAYIIILDHTTIKGLKSHEIDEVKNSLFKRMEQELARQISTEVNVETEQTTSSQELINRNEHLMSDKTDFKEQLSITVNAKFKYELKRNFKDRKTLWAVMVINKTDCSQPLILEALDIIETLESQAIIAIRDNSSKYLYTFESGLKKASQLQATAVWLNSDVDISEYKKRKNALSELIQIIRELETEQELDDNIADILDLIYQKRYDEAIVKTNRVKLKYFDRTEILEIEKLVKDQYRNSILSLTQSDKLNFDNNIELMQDYLRYFPNDSEISSKVEILKQEQFNFIAQKAESAIENEKLRLAKQYVVELSDIKSINQDRFNRIIIKLKELEFSEIKSSLESYWETKDFYNGWNNVKFLLTSSADFLEEKEVNKWKDKFGRRCKRLDYRKERKTLPYNLALSFGTELRTNVGLISDVFNDNNAFQLQHGYFAYSTGLYFRKIKTPSVILKNGHPKDKSKSSFYGIKFGYLHYESLQSLGSYNGELITYYDISEIKQGYEVSLDMLHANFIHFGTGIQKDVEIDQNTSSNSNMRYSFTCGFHIPFSSRRSNIALDVNNIILKESGKKATFNFSAGISWNPYFVRRIKNKALISKKYDI